VAFDPESLTAWQSGLLIFHNQTLTSVVDQINRYRPGKIIVVSADLRRRLVNGRFQIGKLDDFVAQVEQLFDAKVTSLPGGLVILS
jgi:transmembrane sensor